MMTLAVRPWPWANAPPSITSLISSYPILQSLASCISALDLYHLAATSRSHHALVMARPRIFKKLCQQTVCDGRGLAARQAFRPPYAVPNAGQSTPNPELQGDEEIEVFVYNVTCHVADALPCRKCGIPVCEECRYYPRAAPPLEYPDRRPHLTASFELCNIMALCAQCDATTEAEIQDQHYLNELCDCDRYTRWLCLPCHDAEQGFARRYFDECTKLEWDWEDEDDSDADSDADSEGAAPSKWFIDHAFARANPDYPRWTSDADGLYPKPYPRLGYN